MNFLIVAVFMSLCYPVLVAIHYQFAKEGMVFSSLVLTIPPTGIWTVSVTQKSLHLTVNVQDSVAQIFSINKANRTCEAGVDKITIRKSGQNFTSLACYYSETGETTTYDIYTGFDHTREIKAYFRKPASRNWSVVSRQNSDSAESLLVLVWKDDEAADAAPNEKMKKDSSTNVKKDITTCYNLQTFIPVICVPIVLFIGFMIYLFHGRRSWPIISQLQRDTKADEEFAAGNHASESCDPEKDVILLP